MNPLKHYTVIAIGAGPAGSTAARVLAEAGCSVALFDKEKFPRIKPCGGGLVYKARKYLPFDADQVVERNYTGAIITIEKGKFEFNVIRNVPVLGMVMRDKLDELLLQHAVEKGAVMFEDTEVVKIESLKNQWMVSTERNVFSSEFIIAADGAASKIAKMAGWKETRKLIPALEYEVFPDDATFERLSLAPRFDLDAIPYGYGWMFPKANHLSIGIASMKRGKVQLKDYYKKYLNSLNIEVVKKEIMYSSVIPVTPRTDGFYRNRVLLTGDAAGFAEAVTAEGITNSLLSGKLAAEAILNGKGDAGKVEELYNFALQRDILQQLVTGQYLSNLFYNNSWLRSTVFSKYGQELCEYMTDVFTGLRKYPEQPVREIGAKVRKKLFQ